MRSRLAALRRVLTAGSQIVQFSAAKKCFVDPSSGKRYRGITAVTQRLAPSGKGRGGGAPREFVAGPRGRKRGTMVDEQAARVFNAPGGKLKQKMHPFTAKFLSALKAEGLQRVRAQVAVADVDRRIATAVDFVVYRPSDDAVVLIELKCGFESSDSAWLAKQERAHAVQLAVTKRLFALTYPAVKNVRALVFRVHTAGVRVHGVPAEAKALVDSTLAQIQRRKAKGYKKRTFKTNGRGRGGGVGSSAAHADKKGGDWVQTKKGATQKRRTVPSSKAATAKAGTAAASRERKRKADDCPGPGSGAKRAKRATA
jgi:hypothetical protein